MRFYGETPKGDLTDGAPLSAGALSSLLLRRGPQGGPDGAESTGTVSQATEFYGEAPKGDLTAQRSRR